MKTLGVQNRFAIKVRDVCALTHGEHLKSRLLQCHPNRSNVCEILDELTLVAK